MYYCHAYAHHRIITYPHLDSLRCAVSALGDGQGAHAWRRHPLRLDPCTQPHLHLAQQPPPHHPHPARAPERVAPAADWNRRGSECFEVGQDGRDLPGRPAEARQCRWVGPTDTLPSLHRMPSKLVLNAGGHKLIDHHGCSVHDRGCGGRRGPARKRQEVCPHLSPTRPTSSPTA